MGEVMEEYSRGELTVACFSSNLRADTKTHCGPAYVLPSSTKVRLRPRLKNRRCAAGQLAGFARAQQLRGLENRQRALLRQAKKQTLERTAHHPSSIDDVQSLPGILEPTGYFDPAGFSEGVSSSELMRYREAELSLGRVAMLATLGFLIGESGFSPLFEGKISGIGINQFWQVPTGFWPVILLFIAVPETFRALRGWMEPTVPENYFQLRPGYTPGDLDFDPLGLKPTDPAELAQMQTKELNNGRLAMIAIAGMIVQEGVTGAKLF